MTTRRRNREWPLVLGMVLAALLVFASTRVAAAGNHAPPPPIPKSTGLTGFAASPIEAQAATAGTATGTAKPHVSKAQRRHARSKHASAEHSPTTHASPASATPAASTGGGAAAAPQPHVKHESHTQQPSAHTPVPAQPPTALTVPGSSGQATVGGVTFTVRSPTHSPAVGSSWTLGAGAARAGKPVAGSVQMDVVYQGKVMAHMASGTLRDGAFGKKVDWPARAVGYPITVRVKILAGGQTCIFLYGVQVHAA